MSVAGRRRVLVVDDSVALRETIMEVLLRAGYHPCPAGTVSAALIQATTCRHALAIVDHEIGGDEARGMRLIRALRAQGLAIIALVGKHGGRRATLEAGANLCLRKPFSVAQLTTAVNAALKTPTREGTDP